MLNIDQPINKSSIIKVIGVGGGGSNAVNHMFRQGIEGVDFMICNTDIQAIELSEVPVKIQLGEEGHGAGSKPEVGKQAAELSIEKIKEILEKNTKMLFITAGMGGGTGTGAAPVIAETARSMDILTVGIVTMPFTFEGRRRKLQAQKGMEELRKHVDALLVINNDKLMEIHGDLKMTQAFQEADDVLTIAAKGIAEVVTRAGIINVDFEDIKTVIQNSGTAIMGSASAEGEDRAIRAAEEALASPLLNDNKIEGAENILLNITYHEDEISTDEVDDITQFIQKEAGHNAEVIWGLGQDPNLGSQINVTVIATGFKSYNGSIEKKGEKTITKLYDETENETKDEVSKGGKILYTLEGGKDHPVKDLPSSGESSLPKEKETKQTDIFVEEPEIDLENISEPTLISKKSSTEKVAETPLETKEMEELRQGLGKTSRERIKRLRDISIQLKTPQDIDEIERVPAYQRKKVELEEVKYSDDSQVSRYTLNTNEDAPEISESNPYIHDNVD